MIPDRSKAKHGIAFLLRWFSQNVWNTLFGIKFMARVFFTYLDSWVVFYCQSVNSCKLVLMLHPQSILSMEEILHQFKKKYKTLQNNGINCQPQRVFTRDFWTNHQPGCSLNSWGAFCQFGVDQFSPSWRRSWFREPPLIGSTRWLPSGQTQERCSSAPGSLDGQST